MMHLNILVWAFVAKAAVRSTHASTSKRVRREVFTKVRRVAGPPRFARIVDTMAMARFSAATCRGPGTGATASGQGSRWADADGAMLRHHRQCREAPARPVTAL